MNRQYGNRGRDQFNIENAHNVIVQNRESLTRSRSEWLLLQQVKQEVASRLEQSLHNKVLIILGKQTQPEQVKRLWDAEVKIGSKLAEPLLPRKLAFLKCLSDRGLQANCSFWASLERVKLQLKIFCSTIFLRGS